MNLKVLQNKEISSTDKLVFFILDGLKDETGKTIISYPQLAELAGISRRSAIRSVKNLVDAGLIKKEKTEVTIDNGYTSPYIQTVNAYIPLS